MRDSSRYKEIENFKYTINALLGLVQDDKYSQLLMADGVDVQLLDRLKWIRQGLDIIYLIPNNTILKLFNELESAYNSLINILNNNDQGTKINNFRISKNKYIIGELLDKIGNEIFDKKNHPHEYFEQDKVYNSMKFLEERINSINLEKIRLENTIADLVKENKESQLQKEELELKKNELADAASQIEFYQKELELRKKQEDAVNEWKTKIETTFAKLTSHLLPIKDEHKRIEDMFKIYKFLAAIIVFALIVLEIISCCKIFNAIDFPDFKNYIVLFIPVPIAGALLWAFICQMNRAQRQMVILSRYIHEIQYVEGLLLSINSLSPSIDESVKRINLALDRMIDNHLSIGTKDVFTEDRFLNEEKKDGMPYDVVMKILSAFNDIAKKS